MVKKFKSDLLKDSNGDPALKKGKEDCRKIGKIFEESGVVDGDSLYLPEFLKNLISRWRDLVGEIKEGLFQRL